jgi:hypothetical protein
MGRWRRQQQHRPYDGGIAEHHDETQIVDWLHGDNVMDGHAGGGGGGVGGSGVVETVVL